MIDSAIQFNLRPLGRARGEFEFVRETTLKVRWPRRDGVSWRGWEEKHGPALDELMEHGRIIVCESGGVLLGFALWRRDQALYMLYVKSEFRGNGFGAEMLGAWLNRDPPTIVEPTPCWRRWCESRKINYEVVR